MTKWEDLAQRIRSHKVTNYEGQPIVIYCAGDRGKYALFTLRDMGYNVVAFADDAKDGSTFYGLPVIRPAMIPLGSYVVVAVQTVETQRRILSTLRGFASSSIGDFVYPKMMARLDALYYALADDKSRDVLYHVLLAHYEQDSKHFRLIFEDRQYWCMGFLEHSKEHVFVDAGAYTGDTMEDFVRRTRGEFKEIISFEPTPDLKHQARTRADFLIKHWALPLDSICIMEAGLGDVDEKMPLIMKDSDPNGAGNSFYDLVERTGDEVDVYTLDEFMETSPVTFIKADIEGYELNMLKGASKTIETYKPDLAICVYHKTPDLWEIPEYIRSLVPEYKLYLRHHHDEYSETVLYATVL